jgi:peptidyl-prolyl cis-trans isomerase A (cyclophilin A)
MKNLIVAAALLSGCGKKPPQAAGEPVRFAISDGPFSDLCISRVPSVPAPKGNDLEHIERAIRFISEGKLGHATTALGELDDTKHPRARAVKAAVLTLTGNAEDAGPLHEALLAEFPEDGCLGMAAAIHAAAIHDTPLAIARAKAASDADPDSVDARMLWLSMAGTADPTTVLPNLEAASASFPDHAGLAWIYGLQLVQAGRLDDATTPLGIATEAGFPVAAVLGDVHFKGGNIDAYLQTLSSQDVPLLAAAEVGASDTPLQTLRSQMGLTAGQRLHATLHTSIGDMRCELYVDQAPLTVSNFYGLATGQLPWTDPRTNAPGSGPLYQDIVFHRVIPQFMIQGGDPLGQGTGNPGYQFRDEVHPNTLFDRPGRLAMANSGPSTNGSQFFITEVPVSHLDGRHTIFGQCDEAAVELVVKMASLPRDSRDKPKEDIVLQKISFEAE